MAAVTGTTCPRCSSKRLRSSRWSSRAEKLAHPGKEPARCLACSHRFLVATGLPSQHRSGSRPALLLVTTILVLFVSVGGGFWLLWPEADQGQAAARVAEQEAGGAQALSVLEEAARGGDAEAQFRLGRASLLNTAQDRNAAAVAFSWLKQAAANGHGGAMLQLGKLYRSGVGMPQNFELAEKWIRAAAEAGDSDGMVELGRLYRSGLGVDMDAVQAYVWFNRAAAVLNMDGVHERDRIALTLTAEELKLAQAASLSTDADHSVPERSAETESAAPAAEGEGVETDETG